MQVLAILGNFSDNLPKPYKQFFKAMSPLNCPINLS